MVFHLTARIQNREPLFIGMEGAVVARIRRCAASSRCTLLAYVVMPNHLHVVVLQGPDPLAELMQPLMRQIALDVQQRARREGHVFERRYGSAICSDPAYARNAVVYTHLNPVRARMCADPADYRWSSHRAFAVRPAGVEHIGDPLASSLALRLFSPRQGCSLEACRRSYAEFVAWRRAADRLADAGRMIPPPPLVGSDDARWCLSEEPRTRPGDRRLAPDIRLIALEVLRETKPSLPLDELRSGGRTRRLVAARREVIRRCVEAGHRTGRIARFLRIDASTVSDVAAPLRRR